MTYYNDYDEHTWIATIVGAHGIKGAVRARYATDVPNYYLKEKVLFLEKAGSLSALNVIRINQAKNAGLFFLKKLIPAMMLKYLKVADCFCLMII